MKIPEWLPDTKRPTRPDGGSTDPVIDRLSEPFARFFRIEATGGIVLLSCALIALAIADSSRAVAFAPALVVLEEGIVGRGMVLRAVGSGGGAMGRILC